MYTHLVSDFTVSDNAHAFPSDNSPISNVPPTSHEAVTTSTRHSCLIIARPIRNAKAPGYKPYYHFSLLFLLPFRILYI